METSELLEELTTLIFKVSVHGQFREILGLKTKEIQPSQALKIFNLNYLFKKMNSKLAKDSPLKE